MSTYIYIYSAGVTVCTSMHRAKRAEPGVRESIGTEPNAH